LRSSRDLQHQRNFLYPAGRRRARRPSGRVLPLSGCNLWTGREEDRASATCQFCDTDFVGTDGERGGKFKDAAMRWRRDRRPVAGTYAASKYVVFTGGEPLLQLDAALIDAMHAVGFRSPSRPTAPLPVPPGVDWICVSPKMGSERWSSKRAMKSRS
jgi:7-carboxy-7-deazaguanine synthase